MELGTVLLLRDVSCLPRAWLVAYLQSQQLYLYGSMAISLPSFEVHN